VVHVNGESYGQRLQRLREARGLSQRALANEARRLTPGAKITYAYLSRLEADQRNASVKATRALALALGVPADYLEQRPVEWEEVLLTQLLAYARLRAKGWRGMAQTPSPTDLEIVDAARERVGRVARDLRAGRGDLERLLYDLEQDVIEEITRRRNDTKGGADG
jgi:transcriptional regulator with XRE-family HTH domain